MLKQGDIVMVPEDGHYHRADCGIVIDAPEAADLDIAEVMVETLDCKVYGFMAVVEDSEIRRLFQAALTARADLTTLDWPDLQLAEDDEEDPC